MAFGAAAVSGGTAAPGFVSRGRARPGDAAAKGLEPSLRMAEALPADPAAAGESPAPDTEIADPARDALTGLPSRLAFASRLQNAVLQARAGAACSSVLLIDLEGRDRMVRQHGQNTGNRALRCIARRLQAMLKESEMLARLGEDSFAVIAEGQPDLAAHQDAASRLAKRMVSGIREQVAANDTGLFFTANIGIALCRPSCSSGSELLQSAASAMQHAKAHATGFGIGRSCQDEETAEDSLERDLLRAMQAGEIRPFYQPVIDLKADRITAFEALARWRHPKLGFIPPDRFIPMLERMEMMPELSGMILQRVCMDARLWPADVQVSFNVSPSELSDRGLPGRILQIAHAEQMPPERLLVEITETAIVKDNAAAQANLQAFRQAGITTALDDFGTGYASLSQLRHLPFDCLKIDRSFVTPMLTDNDCEAIVNAVLGLAQNLNLRVVAEGIEDANVAAALAARGCDHGQGYYFAKPMTAGEATALMNAGPRWLNAA